MREPACGVTSLCRAPSNLQAPGFSYVCLPSPLSPGFDPRGASKRQLQWSPELEEDVLAVCTEAGLSPGAAEAVALAAFRHQLPSNPGILLSQVLNLMALEDVLGSTSVDHVIEHSPTVLRYETSKKNLKFKSKFKLMLTLKLEVKSLA